MRRPLLTVLLLTQLHLGAQTFTGTGGAIPDDGSTNDFPLQVAGLAPPGLDTALFGVQQVCIDLVHTWNADLEISLVAPDGTVVALSIGNGGADDNYTNTCFEQDAPQSIVAASSPFTGTFRPQGQLGLVNNGQQGNGTWSLRILDSYAFADAGTLLSWNITFSNEPAGYFALTGSDLPIVVINTNGQEIPDDPKIMADMGIIWNGPGVRNLITDPFNHYDGNVGIERRGFSSNGMPKRSYSLETWDVNANAINVVLFGMPAESDWVLSAGYADKTLMRNALTYATARGLGQYAPRTMHVDVVLNGAYIGVYTFCEKVKRDNGRVDIARLQAIDISGDQLTGGYIIKVDKVNGGGGAGWNSLLPPAYNPGGQAVFIQYEEPGDTEIMPQQADYIEAYVDSFELALQAPFPADTLTGYPHFIDVRSWADHFLITELVKNLDGYRSSTFYYKDRASRGGKLKAGPVWDYDLAYGNGNFCDFWRTDGWVYRFGLVCPSDYWQVSGWWEKLAEDTAFQRVVRCRWEEVKHTALSPATIGALADSMTTLLAESQGFNFTVWPILGAYVWPNHYIAQDHQGEVDTLKWFLQERWNWLDANLPAVSVPCNTVGLPQGTPPVDMSARFEGDDLVVTAAPGQLHDLMVLDAQGRWVRTARGREQGHVRIPMAGMPPGLYVVRSSGGGAVMRVLRTP